MSNKVRHVSFAPREKPASPPPEAEPTELQRAVLRRARELRERENEPHPRPPIQWIAAAVLAVVSFGLLFGAVDGVLRKMQQLMEEFSSRPAPAPTAPAPQSQSPDQPYFVELEQPPSDGK